MASYTIAEAKNQLPKLVDKAIAGETVTITRRGKPVARILSDTFAPMSIDLDWLDSVRVEPSGPGADRRSLVEQMRDEDRY